MRSPVARRQANGPRLKNTPGERAMASMSTVGSICADRARIHERARSKNATKWNSEIVAIEMYSSSRARGSKVDLRRDVQLAFLTKTLSRWRLFGQFAVTVVNAKHLPGNRADENT